MDGGGADQGQRSVAGGDGAEQDRRLAVKREALVAEISARLRRVCAHLTDAEFQQLVADITATRLRFAQIDANTFPGQPPRDEPGADDRPRD